MSEIQEFLSLRLEEEAKKLSLFEISKRAKVKTRSLSRLIKQRTASIKTCEALFDYFSTDFAYFYSEKTTLRVIKRRLDLDDALSARDRATLFKTFVFLYNQLKK